MNDGNECSRPIDDLEIEALASGEMIDSKAVSHLTGCASCRARVEVARRAAALLDAFPAPALPADFARRIVSLRRLSGRERRSLSVWAAPLALLCSLLIGSAFLLAPPALSAAEQGGLVVSFAAPLLVALRNVPVVMRDYLRALPPGLSALAKALRSQMALVVVCLLLLVPSSFGLRALFRSRR